jgi:endonuclease/exonuclease/phosphatase family metal-dependent hydrolase
MQWNVHKTKGSDGRCDPDRIANVIVAQNPDVVSLNEINFFSGECAWTFDMGEQLRSLVSQKSGATWYRQSVNGMGGTSGVGNVILSRYPMATYSSSLLSYSRGVAQIGIVVNGRNVNLFSTHLDADNASYRAIQVAELGRFLSGFSEPRILMGDFNMWSDTSEYSSLASWFLDDWISAQNSGTATSYNGTGNTHGGSRLDYVFSTKNNVLAVKSVNVPDPRVNGVFASDHDPVVAVVRVN